MLTVWVGDRKKTSPKGIPLHSVGNIPTLKYFIGVKLR